MMRADCEWLLLCAGAQGHGKAVRLIPDPSGSEPQLMGAGQEGGQHAGHTSSASKHTSADSTNPVEFQQHTAAHAELRATQRKGSPGPNSQQRAWTVLPGSHRLYTSLPRFQYLQKFSGA